MKKLKNTLLSVLLFSFAFLVVHDYMMADLGVSSCKEQSICKVSTSVESTTDVLSAISHLHDSVHTMIVMESDDPLYTSLVPYSKPSFTQLGFATNNNSVLERPPLS